MGCFSWVNTELNWLFRAFALSRSLIIGWSFTRSMGMPMFSRLFALINDQNRFGLVFRLSPMENLGDDGSYLLCSFFKDSSWEFIWACSFILV